MAAGANGIPPDHAERVIRDLGGLLAPGTRSEGPARLSDDCVDTLLAPLDQHATGWGVELAAGRRAGWGRSRPAVTLAAWRR